MKLPESRLSPNLKNKNIHSEKIYYIFSNKVFLTFWDNGTFKRNLKKNEKNRLQKNFLYFRKWNFLALRLKIAYISADGTF